MTQQSSLPQQTPVMTQETELLGGETTPQEESQQPPPSMSSARPLQSQQMSQRQSQFVADTTVDRDALSPYAGLPTISTGHDLSTGAKDDSDDGSEASSVRPPPTLRGPSAYPASATQSGGARFTSSPAEGPTPSGVSFRSRRLASTAPPPSLDAAPWPYARSPSAGVDDSDDGVPTGATSTRDAVSVIGAMSQAVSRATAMTMMTQGTQQGGAQSEGTQPEGYVAAWLGDYGEPTPARPAKRARRCGPFSVAPQDWFTSAEAEAEFDRGHAEYVEEFNKYIAEYM